MAVLEKIRSSSGGMAPCGRALVVFESMFGNTQRLAQGLAWGLRAEGMDVTVCNVESAPARLPADLDLLVLGAPTHAFRLSTPSSRANARRHGATAAPVEFGMREWLAGLPPGGTPQDVAIFDTRFARTRRIPLAASRAIQVLLERRGCRVSTRPVSFVVDGPRGPLELQELEKAVAWGRRLAGIARMTRMIKQHRSETPPCPDRVEG